MPSLFRPGILLILMVIFLVTFLIFKFWMTGWVVGSDGLGYYAHLRSAIIDQDFHYANEFRDFNPHGHGVPPFDATTVTGHVANKYFVGPAILWAPFFLAAHALTHLVTISGYPVSADGYSIFYQLFIGIGSIAYGVAGMVILYRICLLFFFPGHALAAVSLVFFTTNVFYYLTTEPAMTHSLSLFSVSLFLYFWLIDIGDRRVLSALRIGLAGGLMALIRPQDAMFAVLAGLEWIGLAGNRQSVAERTLHAGLTGLVMLVVFLPQMLVWKIIYGSYIHYSYSDESFFFLQPHLLDTLFSARHGLISWTPVILFSLVGLVWFVKKNPVLGGSFWLVFLIQWYLNASWWCWWFGLAFGGRAYINCSAVFAVGLACFLERTGSYKRLVTVGAVILGVWNILFSLQYTLKMLPYDDPVSWQMVAKNQMVLLNRIWEVIHDRLTGTG